MHIKITVNFKLFTKTLLNKDDNVNNEIKMNSQVYPFRFIVKLLEIQDIIKYINKEHLLVITRDTN